MNKLFGFHLIEILITIAIIVMLAVCSVPLYTHYFMGARRFEAENTLSQLAIAMEQFHLEHNSYENAALPALGFSDIIAHGHYQLTIETATHNDYVIAAIPLSDQAKKDTLCASLLLNAQGEKRISGTGSVDECW